LIFYEKSSPSCITLIAMCVAIPIGLFSAIYLGEYASKRTRAVIKPMLEILAGVPTVVYGFFAALTVAPLIRRSGEAIGRKTAWPGDVWLRWDA